MTDQVLPHIGLTDHAIGPPRTTMTLLASLVTRVSTLPLLNGAQAIGSLVSGLAAVGREVAATAEGAALRTALERSRMVSNGDSLWSELHLDVSTSALPPRPVFDDLRNDLALLLAPDLLECLERLDPAHLGAGLGLVQEPEEATFLDFAVGLWVVADEIVAVIGAMAAGATPLPGDEDEPGDAPAPPGLVLR
jgi:hypothetical protein